MSRRHMSDLQDLINAADNLCNSLEVIANNDKKFCVDIQLELERYSWEMYRMKQNLQELKSYHG